MERRVMSERSQISHSKSIDDLLDEIRILYANGPCPTYNSAHAKDSRCPLCNRRQASGSAWKDLKPLEGTNLCWGDCKNELDSTIPIADVMRIIDYFEDQLFMYHDNMD